MTKAVVFDLDDTLINTSETKYAAFKFTAKKFYNLIITDAEIQKLYGLPMDIFMNKLFRSLDTVENLVNKYFSVRNQFPAKPYADTFSTINILHAKKIHLGIVTSTMRKIVFQDLNDLSFPLKKFIQIQTMEDTPVHKPHPDVFKPILKTLKKKRVYHHETIYIGDALRDYFAARDAGLQFYGITDRTTKKVDFLKEGAKTINNLKEILKILDNEQN